MSIEKIINYSGMIDRHGTLCPAPVCAWKSLPRVPTELCRSSHTPQPMGRNPGKAGAPPPCPSPAPPRLPSITSGSSEDPWWLQLSLKALFSLTPGRPEELCPWL